jgi:hypothetical protein
VDLVADHLEEDLVADLVVVSEEVEDNLARKK